MEKENYIWLRFFCLCSGAFFIGLELGSWIGFGVFFVALSIAHE